MLPRMRVGFPGKGGKSYSRKEHACDRERKKEFRVVVFANCDYESFSAGNNHKDGSRTTMMTILQT